MPQKEELNEKCIHCSQMISVRALRSHLQICKNQNAAEERSDEQPISGHNDHTTFLLLEEASSVDVLPSIDFSVPEFIVQPQFEPTEIETRQPQHDSSEVRLETAANITQERVESSPVPESDLAIAVNQCIVYCKTHDISNPVGILQIFQGMIVTGRPLEINDETENTGVTGDTNFIMIDRNNIIQSAFGELNDISDLRKCLEVQFYGETAVDYGGPRKEFFSIILPELQKEFFDPVREWSKDYETIGKIMALSTLQNGRLPRLLSEDLVEEVFISNSPRPFVQDLRKGLDSLGIIQLTVGMPTFIHLFTPQQPIPLTLKMMTNLLQAKFSEEGSNHRVLEASIYSRFIKYMREAASGRRGEVTLEKMLVFVTGTEAEPALGYKMHPTIHFVDSDSPLPTANTCINRLSLSVSGNDIPEASLFNLYDLGFSNAYYGLQ